MVCAEQIQECLSGLLTSLAELAWFSVDQLKKNPRVWEAKSVLGMRDARRPTYSESSKPVANELGWSYG